MSLVFKYKNWIAVEEDSLVEGIKYFSVRLTKPRGKYTKYYFKKIDKKWVPSGDDTGVRLDDESRPFAIVRNSTNGYISLDAQRWLMRISKGLLLAKVMK